MNIIDPVCGMPLDKNSVFGTSSYKGSVYYFCSKECKENFDKDPEALLTMKRSRERVAEVERATALDEMMAQVTHEIRNPLTSIGGFVRKVYEMLSSDDPKREYLKMALEDVVRLENVVKVLVDLKTMVASRVEPINSNELIVNVLEIFERDFEEDQIEVKTELLDNPPAIPVDKEKMIMALANLIKNAVEAMQKTPKLLTITSNVMDKWLVIRISDTGKGIPPDKIRQIFDPFFTSKIYGPGLGLTFTQKIIQGHGGTIAAESEQGKGATFIVRLPLK